MMKHVSVRSAVTNLVVVLAFVGMAALAAEGSSGPVEVKTVREPLRQLGRGVSNLLTGVWEVPFNMYTVSKESGDVAGVTYGLFRGVWRFGARELTGVYETVTFPFGWGPLIEPEFPFEPSRSTDWRVNRLQFLQD